MTEELLKSNDESKFSCRPIISGCDGPTDRVSWLLMYILTPLLEFIPAHLRNTKQVLDSLNSIDKDLLNNACFESFDVTSLYINLDNQAAISCVMKLLKSNKRTVKLHGFKMNDIEMLLQVCLSCNVFKFDDIYYQQFRGLAMDNRLALILAIAHMDYIESRCITGDLILYKRYIDDTILIARDQITLDNVFNTLNNIDMNVKFTREKMDDNGWLPFLDIKLSLKNGLETAWYRKSMKKNIILNANSAHPAYTKLNTANALIHRSEMLSSEKYKTESRSQALNILISNGYEDNYTSNHHKSFHYNNQLPLLRIPFLTDTFTRKLCYVLKELCINAQVVAIPPTNLRQLLMKSRIYDTQCNRDNCCICINKNGLCQVKGCVYRINCVECNGFYIGETMQPLHLRYAQHLGDMRHPQRQRPWSEHIKIQHNGTVPKTSIEVLIRERKLTKRKILEAMCIDKLKPTINIKHEMYDALKFLICN